MTEDIKNDKVVISQEIKITTVEELQELNEEIIKNKEKHSFLELKIFSVKLIIYLITFCIILLLGIVSYLLIKTSNNELGNNFINNIFNTLKVLFEFLDNGSNK